MVIKLEWLWIVRWGAIVQWSSKCLPAGLPAGCSACAQWLNCRPAKMQTVLLDWLSWMSSFEAISSSLSFLAMQPLFGTRQGRFGLNVDVPWSRVIHAVLNFNFYQLAVLHNHLTTWHRKECKWLFHSLLWAGFKWLHVALIWQDTKSIDNGSVLFAMRSTRTRSILATIGFHTNRSIQVSTLEPTPKIYD